MSMPESYGDSEHLFASVETEELMRSLREGVIRDAYSRLDEAHQLEADTRKHFIQEAPIDTEDGDALAILLTVDGIKPYPWEKYAKKQFVLYFETERLERVWIEHIEGGRSTKHILDPAEGVTEVEAPKANVQLPLAEIVPIRKSETEELSDLREIINRLKLTPFSY